MLPLIAAGAAGVGSLLGGRSRNKAAKKARSNTDKMAVWTIEQAKRDAAKALELARGDEERLKGASGYDLVKLRADAERGGFNPLTLLQATGGAGYDGRGAVVMSPFMPIAGFYGDRANLYSGNSGAVINTSGYVGDAIASAGSAFLDQRNQDRANSLEAARVSLLRDELAMAARPFGGGGGVVTTGASGVVTASPFAASISPGPRTQAKINRGGFDLYSLGQKVTTDLGTSNASDYAQRYGELAGDVYGIRLWAWDQMAQFKREFQAMPVFTRRILPEWMDVGTNGKLPFRARVNP